MHGNIWQWCEDFYEPYEGLPEVDPVRTVWVTKFLRVLRGGCWVNNPSKCRSAARHFAPPDGHGTQGFRIAITLPETLSKNPYPASANQIPPVDTDRIAAKYTLSIGGKIRVNGNAADINKESDLPTSSFTLTSVDLNSKSSVTDDGLAVFSNCTSLQRLELGDTTISDSGLANFKNCLDLSTLALYRTRITNQGLKIFADRANLRHLDLGDCRITDEGLLNFRKCIGLQKLVVYNTRLTDKSLTPFGLCRDLIHLDMAGTQISDEGAKSFSSCKKLISLYIWATNIGDEGFKGFALCNDLTILHVHRTKITDASLPAIYNYRKLKIISLVNTKVSATRLADFKSFMPLCQIVQPAWP
jgi:hypothetical protein